MSLALSEQWFHKIQFLNPTYFKWKVLIADYYLRGAGKKHLKVKAGNKEDDLEYIVLKNRADFPNQSEEGGRYHWWKVAGGEGGGYHVCVRVGHFVLKGGFKTKW